MVVRMWSGSWVRVQFLVWLLFRGEFSCSTIDVRLGQNAF